MPETTTTRLSAFGRFADDLVGERAYITASLVAKTLLAWQIFANTLIPT